MIFITGPFFSGKHQVACDVLQCSLDELGGRAVFDAEQRVADGCSLEDLAEELCRYEVVCANEIGSGIVPIDAGERAKREAAGRLACLLAARATVVIRVFCGIPHVIKERVDA